MINWIEINKRIGKSECFIFSIKLDLILVISIQKQTAKLYNDIGNKVAIGFVYKFKTFLRSFEIQAYGYL